MVFSRSPAILLKLQANSTLRKGFNLIEAAIVLAIIGLVIGGIWFASASMNDNRIAADVSRDILSIASRGVETFPARLNPAPAGTTCATHAYTLNSAAIAANVFPPTWVKGNTIAPPVGTVVYFRQWGAGMMGGSGGNVDVGNSLSLIIDNLPYKYCRRILANMAGAMKNNSVFIYVDVGTTGGSACSWGAATTYVMPTNTDMGTSCTIGNTNKIQWVIRSN